MTMTEPTDDGKGLAASSRRRFLRNSGIVVGGAVVAGSLAGSEASAATENVDKPLIFTMDDIRRFPSQSHIYFLECSGNPGYKKPYGKTASDLVGLLSCAEWTGVSLKLVL